MRINIRHLPMRIITGVKNLYEWFNVIWKDRNYDYVFIYKILKRKLQLIVKSNCLSSYDNSRIKCCINLIEKIEDNFYAAEVCEYYENKITKIKWDINKEIETLDLGIKWERFDSYFKLHPRAYRETIKKYKLPLSTPLSKDNKTAVAMYISDEMDNKARSVLLKIVERNLHLWWN